ncbi:TOTE conflict system archaeo-eukaryotic primase domain-containing protein, partial [Succinivibrio sp.]|uniref:TOTE conflict system archaeo-eukaryotic primase domain-containing protein n=1 Tax=Succinivibrio sp. TaxID=2053619 RepID=UPI00386D90AE
IDSYKTFDRMIPAQDRLTGIGLGNLVALPLQCEPLKKGNSCFLDENFVPYLYQFERLASQEKLSESFIKSKIYKNSTRDSFSSSSLLSDRSFYSQELYKQCSDNIFELAKIDLDTTKKVDLNYKNSHEFFTKDMFKDGIFKIYIRDSIYVKHSDVSPHVISILRKISSYANPLYYRNFSNSHYNIKEPRRILCYEDLKYFISNSCLLGTYFFS